MGRRDRSSLAKKSNPNTKAKQTSANQTQRYLSKKKKKKYPIHKPKLNPSKPNQVTHSHIAVVVATARSSSSSSIARSPLFTDRRSEIADRSAFALVLGAPSSPPPSYFSHFLTKMKKWNESQIVDRSSEMADCSTSALVQRCSLLPPAIRPSLKVFLSDSLSDSQSLSLFISMNEKMKWNLWTKTSLTLYTLIAYLILVSLSLF